METWVTKVLEWKGKKVMVDSEMKAKMNGIGGNGGRICNNDGGREWMTLSM